MARILVVEDEPLISMMLGDWLAELGHETVGPAGTVAEALVLIGKKAVDAAVLDINLRKERCDRIAEELAKRAIPFALATAEFDDGTGPSFGEVMRLMKPYDFDAVRETVTILCGNSGFPKAVGA